MSNKPAINPQDLRHMAEALMVYVTRYRELANDMESLGITTLPVTGLATFEDKVLANLGRNTRRLATRIQAAVDTTSAKSAVSSAEKLAADMGKKAKKKGT